MAMAEPPVSATMDKNSPQIASAPSFGSLNGPASPVGNVPSPTRYDFDFGLSQNPFQTQGPEQWSYDGEKSALDMYSSSQGMFGTGLGNQYEQPATIDPSALYGGSSTSSQFGSGGFFGMSGVAPSSAFPAPGLPFHGFDYIRNYDSYPANSGEQDILGQGFDAGAFRFDPELPFSLGDLPAVTEPTRDGHQQ